MSVFFTMFKQLWEIFAGECSNPFSTAHRFTILLCFLSKFPLVLESPQTWILDMDVSKNRGGNHQNGWFISWKTL